MKYVPRDYQIEAVSSIFSYFDIKGGNPLLAMPTGTGKAVVIAMFLEMVFKAFPSQKVLILTHVQELIAQNYDKLLSYWPGAPAGINSEGLKRREYLQKILFCGIQSVYKDAHLFGNVNLIIIDEAHLVSPDDKTRYQTFIKELRKRNPKLKVIGLTATKWRMGQGCLTDGDDALFTDICFDITGFIPFNRLLDEGYLAPLIPKKTKTLLNVDGVGMENGDFKKGALQLAVDKYAITEAAILESIEHASDRHVWLVFGTGIEHCGHISEMLTHFGISNVVIHSKMKKKQRDDNYEIWRSGQVKAAVNFGVLTTGVDYPELDCIVMLRPTASSGLWVQMLGRGTRPVYAPGPYDLTKRLGRLAAMAASQKQNCLVLDFGGNTKRLGPINDPIIPKRKGAGGGEAPVKECPVCGTYQHTSVRICKGLKSNNEVCNHEFTFEVKIKQEASTDDLIKTEFPIVEVFAVEHVTYTPVVKKNSPPMMRVSYYSGIEKFSDIVCVEHDGYPLHKAKEWWRRHSDQPMPTNVDDAIHFATEKINPPTHIRVWINKKPWPEVTAYCYDGTAFGKKADTGVRPMRDSPMSLLHEDDDIPF